MPFFAVCDVKLDPKGGSPGNLQFRKLQANINERCLCKLKSSCFLTRTVSTAALQFLIFCTLWIGLFVTLWKLINLNTTSGLYMSTVVNMHLDKGLFNLGRYKYNRLLLKLSWYRTEMIVW